MYTEKGLYEKYNFLRKREDKSQPLIRSIKTALTVVPPFNNLNPPMNCVNLP